MDPEVTIIVPTHNRKGLLEESIASADAAIRAAGVAGEIIVIDDASTDGTAAWLRMHPYGVKPILFSMNRGRSAARDEGLAAAGGRFVKFLDSDDCLEVGSLARELESGIREQADIVVAGWGVLEIDGDGKEIEYSRRTFSAPEMHPIPDTLLLGRAVPTSAALYRREFVRDLRWDPRVGNLDDWHWFCQAAWCSRVISRVEGVAYWMRTHRGQRVTSHLSRLECARSLVRVLDWMEQRLHSEGQFTLNRSRRLAQYYYKELRVLCLFDRSHYEEVAKKILSLDGEFVPRDEEKQAVMRLAARMLGFRRATELHCQVKTALERLGLLGSSR